MRKDTVDNLTAITGHTYFITVTAFAHCERP